MSLKAHVPLRILLVEDHGDTSHVLLRTLERRGHAVTAASGVAEALELFDAVNPEVLISDIGLPDGCGWDLLSRLRQRGTCPLLAIAMSGYGSEADRLGSRAVGYAAHLIKPFKAAELHRLLEERLCETSFN